VRFLVEGLAWHNIKYIQKLATKHMYILRYNRSRFFSFVFFMQKLQGKPMDMFNKSCSVFYLESNKIGFAFFWICYDFLRILQVTGPGCKENKIQNITGRSLVHGSTPGTYIHTPGGRGELAAGDVGPAGDDKRHRAAIGTPNDRLAASAWPEGSPVSGGGDAGAARPQQLECRWG
jgi:hypothetical protein